MATRFAPPPASTDAGYNEDFALWSAEQAAHLRAGRLDMLDLENIAEEIESLGKSDRRAIVSHLRVASEHLIKLRYAADEEPRAGWLGSVRRARVEIADLLEESPSLRRDLPALLERAWPGAQPEAIDGLPRTQEQTLAKLAGQFLDADKVLTVGDEDFPRVVW